MSQRVNSRNLVAVVLFLVTSFMEVGCSGGNKEQVAQAAVVTSPLLGPVEEVVRESGPLRRVDGGYYSQAIRYRRGNDYQIGIDLWTSDEVTVETAKRLVDVLKHIEENDNPIDPSITDAVVTLTFLNLNGEKRSLESTVVNGQKKQFSGAISTLEQALGDVEALKAAKASYLPLADK